EPRLDAIWMYLAEKVKDVFPYGFWHQCGRNLPRALELIRDMPGIKGDQYDMSYYGQDIQWPQRCEQVAGTLKSSACAMNPPTTQMPCHGTADEIRQAVREFIDSPSRTRPPA